MMKEIEELQFFVGREFFLRCRKSEHVFRGGRSREIEERRREAYGANLRNKIPYQKHRKWDAFEKLWVSTEMRRKDC